MLVAHRSTSEEIGILRKVFQTFDTSGSGHLNYEEFTAALHEAGYSDGDYQELFDAVDMDGSGLMYVPVLFRFIWLCLLSCSCLNLF